MTLLLNYPQKYDNKDNLLQRGENTLPRYAAVNDLKFLFMVMTEKFITNHEFLMLHIGFEKKLFYKHLIRMSDF